MAKENKKIRNATVCHGYDLTFKSQLEKSFYNTLQQLGFNPQYEPKTFTLIDPFESSVPFYDKESDRQLEKRRENGDNDPRKLVKKSSKVQGIKYTPDFYFKYNDLDVYIEAKGIENDRFYLVKKLFLRYLNGFPNKSIYFEIYTKKQLLQALKIIEDYGRELTQTDSAVNHESSTKGHSVGKKVRGRKEL